MAENEQELTREQVVTLIGNHAKRLADLARDHGFGKLHVRLHLAAQQAEKDLETLTAGGENVKE